APGRHARGGLRGDERRDPGGDQGTGVRRGLRSVPAVAPRARRAHVGDELPPGAAGGAAHAAARRAARADRRVAPRRGRAARARGRAGGDRGERVLLPLDRPDARARRALAGPRLPGARLAAARAGRSRACAGVGCRRRHRRRPARAPGVAAGGGVGLTAVRAWDQSTRPDWWANTTSCARSRAPSLIIARLTWVRAVAGLSTSSEAISSLDRPRPTSATTSRSRAVRSPILGCGVSTRARASSSSLTT